MTPTITIDCGNTNPHFRVYEKGQTQKPLPLENLKDSHYFNNTDINFVISKVGKEHTFLNDLGERLISLEDYRKEKSFLSMPVNYTKTLGLDRLYQGYYLYKNSETKKVLIDAGTFITIDFISKNGFEGGYILPGERTFLKSYTNGEQLPELSNLLLNYNEKSTLPQSTEEAILDATIIYLSSIYKRLLKEDYEVVLTGGDCEKHEALIKSLFDKREIESNPHLIHDSLYFIFNETKNLPQ